MILTFYTVELGKEACICSDLVLTTSGGVVVLGPKNVRPGNSGSSDHCTVPRTSLLLSLSHILQSMVSIIPPLSGDESCLAIMVVNLLLKLD
jgi:hypothetical protein